MVKLICFFIVLALLIFEIWGSNPAETDWRSLSELNEAVRGVCTCGGHASSEKRESASRPFYDFLTFYYRKVDYKSITRCRGRLVVCIAVESRNFWNKV